VLQCEVEVVVVVVVIEQGRLNFEIPGRTGKRFQVGGMQYSLLRSDALLPRRV